MFTGLIQAIGKVSSRSQKLLIEGCENFSPLKLGDSVAVDGVCLTASQLLHKASFVADVSEETLKRTSLGEKSLNGGFVNLEPALRLSDRLGGHLVSGHIDGKGQILSIRHLNTSWILEISLKDTSMSRFICEKASIAVDGVSLTIAETSADDRSFSIAVIPPQACSGSGSTLNKEICEYKAVQI